VCLGDITSDKLTSVWRRRRGVISSKTRNHGCNSDRRGHLQMSAKLTMMVL